MIEDFSRLLLLGALIALVVAMNLMRPGRRRRPYGARKGSWRPRIVQVGRQKLQPTDPADQLRRVTSAKFEKRRLLSQSEVRFFYAAEKAITQQGLSWRVMAQVSLGEVLSSPDPEAFRAINSKRVDLLIITSGGYPVAAIEYQGEGHYQAAAAVRDAVKKEALRRAGIAYLEFTPSHGAEDVAREIARLASAQPTRAVAR